MPWGWPPIICPLPHWTADPGLRHGKAGVLGRDAEAGGCRDADAAAHGDAVSSTMPRGAAFAQGATSACWRKAARAMVRRRGVSGNRPIPVSGMAKRVFSVATRKRAGAETPTPPPMPRGAAFAQGATSACWRKAARAMVRRRGVSSMPRNRPIPVSGMAKRVFSVATRKRAGAETPTPPPMVMVRRRGVSSMPSTG
jgi:hypothetical protein